MSPGRATMPRPRPEVPVVSLLALACTPPVDPADGSTPTDGAPPDVPTLPVPDSGTPDPSPTGSTADTGTYTTPPSTLPDLPLCADDCVYGALSADGTQTCDLWDEVAQGWNRHGGRGREHPPPREAHGGVDPRAHAAGRGPGRAHPLHRHHVRSGGVVRRDRRRGHLDRDLPRRRGAARHLHRIGRGGRAGRQPGPRAERLVQRDRPARLSVAVRRPGLERSRGPRGVPPPTTSRPTTTTRPGTTRVTSPGISTRG